MSDDPGRSNPPTARPQPARSGAAALHIARANTVLYCARWRETVDFYRDDIGLAIEFENAWFVEFRITESAFVSVADSSHASVRAVGGQGITLTFQVDDIVQARDQLLGRGIDVTPIGSRWRALTCYAHDPEGHRIEFWASPAPSSRT